MKKLPIIIDEMKALRGADVRVFGQPTTLYNEVSEDELLIDVVDVLEAIEEIRNILQEVA